MRHWKTSETTALQTMRAAGCSFADIAAALGRSESATQKAYYLNRPPASGMRAQALDALTNGPKTQREVGSVMGGTSKSVANALSELVRAGLVRKDVVYTKVQQ